MRLRILGTATVASAVLVASGSAATTAVVTMPGTFYAPQDLDVLVGTTVTWQNADRSTHTVTEDDDAFDSGHIRPGQTFALAFDEPGTYRFHCTIHRFMRGSVGVFEVVLHGPGEPLPAGRRARLVGVAPAGGEEIELVRVLPAPREVVARARSGADGSFAFVVRAPEPRRYLVRAGTATSPRVRVRVAPRVSIEARVPGVAVRAVPARPRSRVVLQRYDNDLFAFVTVARGRLDERSRVTIPYAPETSEHVRAVVLGQGGWSDGASRPLVLRAGEG
jgi:plastocyanin